MPKRVTRMNPGDPIGKPPDKPKKVARKKTKKATGVSLASIIPTKKTKRVIEPIHSMGLLIGEPKVGKTTFLASFPDTLFFMTEPGRGALSLYEVNEFGGGVTSWDIFREAVDALEGTKNFDCVVIDTAAGAYDLCVDWVCKKLNIEYPGVNDKGSNDFGKSWRYIAKEFTHQIMRIKRSGRGVWFTAHSMEEEIKPLYGDSYTKIKARMTPQCGNVIKQLCDFIFYLEVMKTRKGENIRVITTQFDELLSAGHRDLGIGKDLPAFIPIEKEGGFDVIDRACKGEDVGISAEDLMPRNTASQAVSRAVTKEKIKERTNA